MKKAKPTETPDETLAARWRCDERTIRRWRKSGAPLDDEARMWVWLAGQRTLPRGTAELRSEHRRKAKAQVSGKPQLSAPTAEGAGAALKRLEAAEARAHAELLAAEAAGDLFAKRAAEASWLRISTALLRYDVQIEATRRDSGALIQRDIVEKALRNFGAATRIAVRSAVHAATPAVAHASIEQVGRTLNSLGSSLAATMARVFVGSPSELPEWAVKCFTAGFDSNGDGWSPEQAEASKRAVEFLFSITNEQARTEAEQAHRIFRENAENDWREFQQWRAQQRQDGTAQRAEWCRSRAAQGLPVPDASDAELAQFPGLSRS